MPDEDRENEANCDVPDDETIRSHYAGPVIPAEVRQAARIRPLGGLNPADGGPTWPDSPSRRFASS